MKTRITELFGIEHPIVMPGMGIVGNADLVIAVTNAGGLGFLGSSFMDEDEINESIKRIKDETEGKPFGVNLMEGDPRTKEIAQIVIDEKIPIVGHGKGSPEWLLKMMTDAGILKIPTVGKLSHALRAEQDGADAIIVQGNEGGGHTGYASTLVLVNKVAREVKIPVIAAGGFADGKGLVAALALGADGIAMGTRFAVTQESPIHGRSKQAYINTTEDNTVVTALVTGTRSRGIKNELTDFVDSKGGNLPIWQALPAVLEMRRAFHYSLWDLMVAGLKMKSASELGLGKLANMPGGISRYRKMIYDGDAEWGWAPCGQVIGLVNDLPTCKEVIDGTMAEAENIIRSLNKEISNK
jgi:NAD(P)H-dependent flavin oxidoreductase YrpB (nitropropane dioxygenase family)